MEKTALWKHATPSYDTFLMATPGARHIPSVTGKRVNTCVCVWRANRVAIFSYLPASLGQTGIKLSLDWLLHIDTLLKGSFMYVQHLDVPQDWAHNRSSVRAILSFQPQGTVFSLCLPLSLTSCSNIGKTDQNPTLVVSQSRQRPQGISQQGKQGSDRPESILNSVGSCRPLRIKNIIMASDGVRVPSHSFTNTHTLSQCVSCTFSPVLNKTKMTFPLNKLLFPTCLRKSSHFSPSPSFLTRCLTGLSPLSSSSSSSSSSSHPLSFSPSGS